MFHHVGFVDRAPNPVCYPRHPYSSNNGDDGGPGEGWVFPTKFIPPSASVKPLELFSGWRQHMSVARYTLPNDAGIGLIHADGACRGNGQFNPRAGWAIWHGFGPSGERLVASGRIEEKGPFGDYAEQTNNRAELHAVIAALCFRHWPGEGFHTLVIATDSAYVVEGSTYWAQLWVRNGWRTSVGASIANQDLWEVLLGEVERYQYEGMAVELWRIPREWNGVADRAAKDAAARAIQPNEWQEVSGAYF